MASMLWSSSSRRHNNPTFTSSPASQLTRFSAAPCTTERGLLYKNAHGQSVRIYSHIPTPTPSPSPSLGFDRYSLDEDNSSSRTNVERSCYLNTNCVMYALLRAKADGITFDMLFDLLLESFSEDLRELDWASFESDVKSVHFDESDEMFKILNDAILKAKIQDFSGTVKKADLTQMWPVLCKYGQLKSVGVQDRGEEDANDDLIKKCSDQVGLLAEEVINLKPCDDECVVIEKHLVAAEKFASCKVIDGEDRASSSCDMNAGHEGSEESIKKMQLVVAPSSSSKMAHSSSNIVSGKRLMLLLVFLMVIYRGLNMLVQQRKVKAPSATPKPTMDVLVD